MNGNISRLQQILASGNISCWLLCCDHNSDPAFRDYISTRTIGTSLAVITPTSCQIIVSSLDADNIPGKTGAVLVYGNNRTLLECLQEALRNVNFPPAIAFNYSTMRDAQTDLLGHGMYTFLTSRIRKMYHQAGRSVTFRSAEKLIYALYDQKSAEEITKLKITAKRALEIIGEAFRQLQPGTTEKQFAELVHEITQTKPAYFQKEGVISENYAWEMDGCPIVLAGANFAKGGHALPSDKPILPGETVYIDFGVQLEFADGSKWSSDLQRMAYVLKPSEKTPPPEVQKIFSALTVAITRGIQALKPGTPGYKIDQIVRSTITDAGYPSYDHSTGHPIGTEAHGLGTALAPKQAGRSALKIQPNGVYTIEPRIKLPNGGSIEEMVLATPDGGIPLCRCQSELYLIS